MEWKAQIMPDDALSNSLVGVMLNGEAEAAPVPVAEPDFRALCVELLEGIETDCIDWNDRERFQSLIDRARAALEAQP